MGFIVKQLQRGFKFRFKELPPIDLPIEHSLLAAVAVALLLTGSLLCWIGALDTSFFVAVLAGVVLDSTLGAKGVTAFSLKNFSSQLSNLVNSVPSDRNLKAVFASRAAFLQKHHDKLESAAGYHADTARLQSKWSGFVLVKGGASFFFLATIAFFSDRYHALTSPLALNTM